MPGCDHSHAQWAVEVGNRRGPTTIIKTVFDLAIHSGGSSRLHAGCTKIRADGSSSSALLRTSRDMAHRSRRTICAAFVRFFFVERGSVQPWSFGSPQGGKRVIFTVVFRTSDLEQMRMGVLEHLGIAQAPAWLFAAELREGTVVRLLTSFERTVPILAVRPASRRMSTKVRIFIEHVEETFALCSQFNPRTCLNSDAMRGRQ